MLFPRSIALTFMVVLALACDRGEPPRADTVVSAAVSASATTAASAAPTGPPVEEHVVLSEVYEVDRIYKSMQGPSSTNRVALGAKEKRELLSIVGFEAVMMDPEGAEQISQEFMCHTNLDLDIAKHQARFGDDKRLTGRLFTLSQGQHRIDFPEGFGIPIISDELLDVNTQVLNLNIPEAKRQVRHRVTMRFVRDSALDKPMKALFVTGAFGLKLLEGKDGHYGLETKPEPKPQPHADHHEHHGNGECLPGAAAGDGSFDDGKGRTFTGHWVVSPGKEVNHTRVTELMALPFDTTVHYVAVHLHPFAESLELRDMTAGRTVYTAKTRQAEQGIGLAHVDFFSSPEGLPLVKDHEYEVVSVYNNTTSEDQDSMAVLNLYLWDKAFKKPDLSAPPPGEPSSSSTPAAAPKSM